MKFIVIRLLLEFMRLHVCHSRFKLTYNFILCFMFKSNIKPQEIRGRIQSGHSHMKLKSLGMPRLNLQPMIWFQINRVWLNVAQHEIQTWRAHIQPETINFKSNQTSNPKKSEAICKVATPTWNLNHLACRYSTWNQWFDVKFIESGWM